MTLGFGQKVHIAKEVNVAVGIARKKAQTTHASANVVFHQELKIVESMQKGVLLQIFAYGRVVGMQFALGSFEREHILEETTEIARFETGHEQTLDENVAATLFVN
jgi:hypothetical protein